MRKLLLIVLLTLAGHALVATSAAAETDYLYYRDANVPPFQKSREFFDMPNRPGIYEVTMVSDTVGPLTFRVVRVHDGDKEDTIHQKRSYKVGGHEFQARFNNMKGEDDLIVEIANSNPAAVAKVSVYVVELPRH